MIRAWLAALEAVAQLVNAAVGYRLVSVNLAIVPRDVETVTAFLWERRRTTVDQLKEEYPSCTPT